MKVKSSELDALKGCEPREAYVFAKKHNWKVLVIGDELLPTRLFYKTLYIRLDDCELIEGAWISENHLEYDIL